MSQTFNIYCDESCHLENDGQKVMVLGAVWCPLEKSRVIAEQIRKLKVAHGLDASFEIKWTKVSPAKVAFYQAVLDYFFEEEALHFRAWVIPDKTRLQHAAFGQDHDTWYYKMMFGLLEPLLSPDSRYRIYLDQKDTRSAGKVKKLHEVLCNNLYDFDRRIIDWVQVVESHAVEQLQLADLLIGAVGYVNRGLMANPGKQTLVKRMQERSQYSLTRTTLLRESKVNLFIWHPQGGVA
jgi:hypothetical protein